MIRDTAEQIETQAADWLARLDRDGWSEPSRLALEAWLAGDVRRRGAFLQAQAALALLDAGAADEPYSEAMPAVGIASPDRLDGPSSWRVPRRALLAGGGALAASLAAGLLLIPRGGEQYATGVGEIRRVPLADGTVIAINTQSQVRVALADSARIVELDQGEAWFQVAKDPARPFVAEAGPVRVRAVGTAFSVRRRANGAEVAVSEGVVEAWVDGAEARKIRLAAGQAAFLRDDATAEPRQVTIADVDRGLAWRSGQIDFAGENLDHAIAEFNRYNRRKLVLGDPRLKGEPLYGVFRTDDPEGFAQAVGEGFGVPVRRGAGAITIGAPD